tara:strand:- start:725 stop:1360 length:636 start_codon:yes stop_codon:yes gene_type:complete
MNLIMENLNRIMIQKHDVKQRSLEWEKLRVGKVGGSEALSLTTPARIKSLLYKKVAEIQTGFQEEIYISADMQHGIDTEPIAVACYEKETFQFVEEGLYITNPKFKYLGLSPDGLVGTNGAIEIKCPKPKQHCKAIIDETIPTENRPQIAHYFLVNENLDWVDFVSYCEDVKKKPMYIYKCTREDFVSDIAKLENGYISFKVKLENFLNKF